MWASVIGLRANATAIDGADLDPLGVLGAEQAGEERVVARLGRPGAVVAGRLGLLGGAGRLLVVSKLMPPSTFMAGDPSPELDRAV